MKKYLSVILGCSLLGACVAHETDLQAAQEKRDFALMQKRSETGCAFIRDHDAYRQCVMNTYYLQHPQTYETQELTTGQSMAVISNPPAGCGCGNTCSTRVAPLPARGPQIMPYSTSESRTTETTCTQNYQAQEASVTTTEVLPPPQPVQIVTKPAPEPEPDPTWWETYQTKKKPEPVPATPVCPCPDPNDPCPQCFDK